MRRLTQQQQALLAILEEDPTRGYDLDELAQRLSTSREGAAATGASLWRRGLVDRFIGGLWSGRVHYQAAGTIKKEG